MINDLKELEKLFKICRKQGVTEISLQGMSIKFGDLPFKASAQADETDEIPTEELSPDQLIYYATQEAGQI